ncbi:unnamed protein product [Sphagnum troendelagicum]|uniref:Uncharacterized protein n=1 Tax=Sphagnum troendelagicum TaxID=128251 RepID=A0ABP0TDV6_9BRYO
MLSLSSRAQENVVPFVITQYASRWVAGAAAEQAFLGGRCPADRELFDVPSLVVANMLPLSLWKTAQGHPILIFLCLLLSNCQKLILS